VSKFNVCILPPNKDYFFRAFDEAALSVFYGLQALGHDVVFRHYHLHTDRINIVFGAKNYDPGFHPDLNALRVVIFNCEPLDLPTNHNRVNAAYFELLARHPVWDYSQRNIQEMAKRCIQAQHIEFAYAPELSRIEPSDQAPIYDVLFFGTLEGSARRHAILVELEDLGLKIKVITNFAGRYRDALIAQSKLVVNIGFADNAHLEMVRLSYLLNNDVAVVSEVSASAMIDEGLRAALQPVGYGQLAKECLRLARDDDARRERIRACSAYFKSPERSMAKGLQPALADLASKSGWEISAPQPTSLDSAQRAKREYWAYPPRLNIGCGLQHVKGWINADLDPRVQPDWLVDFSQPLPFFNEDIAMGPFGGQKIVAGTFTKIQAHHVLQSVRDIVPLMKNCLDLLCEGGELDILVPYDLSLSAWQRSETVRAFNETSFHQYCDGHATLGWSEYRFTAIKIVFVLNAFGEQLEKKKINVQDISRTPRAVEYLHAILKKTHV
jgi:hypothetical protein